MNGYHMQLARELKVPVGVINDFWKEARKDPKIKKMKRGSARKMFALRAKMLEQVEKLKQQKTAESEAAKAAEVEKPVEVAAESKPKAKKEEVANG